MQTDFSCCNLIVFINNLCDKAIVMQIKAKKEEIIANTVLENETVIEVTERLPLIISVNQNIHLSGNVPDTLLRAKGVRGYFCNKIAHIPYVF